MSQIPEKALVLLFPEALGLTKLPMPRSYRPNRDCRFYIASGLSIPSQLSTSSNRRGCQQERFPRRVFFVKNVVLVVEVIEFLG